MGYALDLRVARLDDITGQLTTPTLTVDDLAPDLVDRLDDRVADNFDLLASTIADAVADGSGRPDGALVGYVVAVIAHHSHSWPPLDYSSASEDWFRDELVGTHLAGLLGSEAAGHLLARPIAGLEPADLPAWGHLTADEVAALADRDLSVAPDQPEAATLGRVAAVVTRAARLDRAIVTIHA